MKMDEEEDIFHDADYCIAYIREQEMYKYEFLFFNNLLQKHLNHSKKCHNYWTTNKSLFTTPNATRVNILDEVDH